MALYTENFANRILEVLNYPLVHRCPELGLLFDRCSVRELQEIFPEICRSIFGGNGGTGWGLRTISKEANPQDFEILYNFFIPLGPMFRLCYRLLNDAIKFELSAETLPHKMNEMLQSGRYSVFYADLITIDPFKRCITSLSLNAFDYFIINFVIHGTLPLHRMFPAALNVHNERSKTIFFFLTADYLCSFLPSNPDAVVMPTNICGTVKAPQPIPVQPLQPARSPKYLNLSPISHFTSANKVTSRTPESPRAYAWRTETVLYFFVDTWLRYDVDETRDLPSSEFIRVVRILVKQLHAFGNSADLDNTSMSILRKLAQPMMNARIYPFLKSVIARWPLDSSLSVVLELWLSYIQPWRYTYDRHFSNASVEIPISPKYETFISENMIVYTQIFAQILPRFERLDFSSFRNVAMLHRLIKVFSQTMLSQILQSYEQKLTQSMFPMSSSTQTSPKRILQSRTDQCMEWDSFRNENYPHEDGYISMFGETVKYGIQSLVTKVYIAKLSALEEIKLLNQTINSKNRGFWKYLKQLIFSIFDEASAAEIKLHEIKKIPDILDLAIHSLSYIFEVCLPNISIEHMEHREPNNSQADFTGYDGSDMFDISQVSPARMRTNISNIKMMNDPALLPIQYHECTVLVRFLHQVSCKINLMFPYEMKEAYGRNDIWGKLSRQILSPPLIVQSFDKTHGISRLQEDHLPPRICLRFLASYQNLALIPISFIIGQFLWGIPSLGFLLLILLLCLYTFFMAIIS